MRTFYEKWSILESIPNSNLEPAGAKIQNETIEPINYLVFNSTKMLGNSIAE